MGIFDLFRKKPGEGEPKGTSPPAPEGQKASSPPTAPASPSPPEPAVHGSSPPSSPMGVGESAGPVTEESSGGIFARFQRGLQKTAQLLRTDIRDLFKHEGELVDDEFLGRLYALAIRTDMGTGPAGELRDQVQREFRGRVVTMDDVLVSVKAKLRELMDQSEAPLQFAPQGTTVILVVGVNGTGKTTSIAKLARMLRREGKSIVLGAGDTFRAAAVEQLTIWAERIGAEIVKGAPGADPASVAFQAVNRALEIGADVCIVDTAGRLQTQANLMDQLGKIRRVISKKLPDAPHEVLLVLDATAGQNAISQARGFSEAAGCTGIVLAKLDGTAKGGVVIPIRRQFQIPVKYVGVGEGLDDLALFQPAAFVDALFEAREPASSR